jgi:glycosyltransferase involved in cell wall biosynthesis
MKITHIINGLGNGGAEKNLLRLIIKDKKNNHEVIVLRKINFYNNVLKKEKIRFYQFDLSFNLNLYFSIKKINQIIKKSRPDILMCWMYHASLLGTLITLLKRKIKLIWNIRHSSFVIGKSKFATIFLARFIMPFFQLTPKAIVYNSLHSLKIHNIFYFLKKKQIVIRNGFELPLKKNKKNKTNEKNFLKIGFVGRFSPQKNHYFFFEFLSKLKLNNINFTAFLVGRKINKSNHILINLVKKFNLEKNIKLLKEKKNIDSYYQKFDILISTSFYGESFPNILAESMINKTICLAPNVGENYFIINNKNLIYKKNNLNDLYLKFNNIIKFKNKKRWHLLKRNLYNRAKTKLTIEKMLMQYENLFNSLK